MTNDLINYYQNISTLLLQPLLDSLWQYNEDKYILQNIHTFLLHISLQYTQDYQNQDQNYHNLYYYHIHHHHESQQYHYKSYQLYYMKDKSNLYNIHKYVQQEHKYLQHHYHSLHSFHILDHHLVVHHNIHQNSLFINQFISHTLHYIHRFLLMLKNKHHVLHNQHYHKSIQLIK